MSREAIDAEYRQALKVVKARVDGSYPKEEIVNTAQLADTKALIEMCDRLLAALSEADKQPSEQPQSIIADLDWILGQERYTFAECTLAEEIMSRIAKVRAALSEQPKWISTFTAVPKHGTLCAIVMHDNFEQPGISRYDAEHGWSKALFVTHWCALPTAVVEVAPECNHEPHPTVNPFVCFECKATYFLSTEPRFCPKCGVDHEEAAHPISSVVEAAPEQDQEKTIAFRLLSEVMSEFVNHRYVPVGPMPTDGSADTRWMKEAEKLLRGDFAAAPQSAQPTQQPTEVERNPRQCVCGHGLHRHFNPSPNADANYECKDCACKKYAAERSTGSPAAEERK